jgi:hypothetical protein
MTLFSLESLVVCLCWLIVMMCHHEMQWYIVLSTQFQYRYVQFVEQATGESYVETYLQAQYSTRKPLPSACGVLLHVFVLRCGTYNKRNTSLFTLYSVL